MKNSGSTGTGRAGSHSHRYDRNALLSCDYYVIPGACPTPPPVSDQYAQAQGPHTCVGASYNSVLYCSDEDCSL